MKIKSKHLAIILTALEFSSNKHRDQRRKDDASSPYINHPISLANVLCNEAKINDQKVICAALLHDTIEDTETTAEELEAIFGKSITKIVLEVTDDKTLPKAARKLAQIEHAKNASKRAKLVKLADKICNLRDILFSPPLDWPLKRKQEYFDWSKSVVDEIRGTNKKLEKIFDELYAARP
jgi:guanosine-3',5'-bis(diphosphate) 3'-pyrophosphohydrolase